MSIKRSTLRTITGAGLAVATFATRYPIRARTLFEFDSIDFAIATTRFNLRQVTPHVPGDILHIIGARILNTVTPTVNDAFVWQSMLLSVLSVLFMWRAAVWLRGERVGLLTAILWLTTPLFWFMGGVATAYIQEAFYLSALLYFGFSWIRLPNSFWRPILLALTLALSIGARQNDVLFFAPAIVYLFVTIRPRKNVVAVAFAVFAVVCAAWLADLLIESGGLGAYLSAFQHEEGFRSQSILFGNSWHHQLNATAKVLVLLPLLGASGSLALAGMLAFWPKRTTAFIRESFRSRATSYAICLAAPSFLFYSTIYFMKAGYLLTIIPIVVLLAAVLLDTAAIWMAQKNKRMRPDRLTRPLITRNAILLTAAFTTLNVVWFLYPFRVMDDSHMFDEATRESFSRGVESRISTSRSSVGTVANRVLSNSNVRGIRAIDRLHWLTEFALRKACSGDSATIVATWWSRQAYAALPNCPVFDIEPRDDTLTAGISEHYWRTALQSNVITLPRNRPVIFLVRHDNPEFRQLSEQAIFDRLPLPEYLDAYHVTNKRDTLRWRNLAFVFK